MMHDVNLSAYALALKIQVSGATADLLHTLRGYVLTCRGTLNVKVTSPGWWWYIRLKTSTETDWKFKTCFKVEKTRSVWCTFSFYTLTVLVICSQA